MKGLKLIRDWDLPWKKGVSDVVCHVVNIGPTLSRTQFIIPNFPIS